MKLKQTEELETVVWKLQGRIGRAMKRVIVVKEVYISRFRRMLGLALLGSFFFIVATTFLTFSDLAEYRPFWGWPWPQLPPIVCNMSVSRDEKLDEVLAAATRSTGTNSDDKTVIITVVNKAYVEGDRAMLDLFVDRFREGEGTRELINRLVVAAMDRTSYQRCRVRKLHCYKLQETGGVDFVGEKVYMSEDFIKMMWRRTLFLGDVIKRGYTFVFTDTDVLWLRNPLPNLNQNKTLDLQISADWFNGDPSSESNPINTGFYMVRPSNRTAALFDTWYSIKDTSAGRGLKEQDVLHALMRLGLFRKLGLRVRFLDTVYFSGFCQDSHNASLVVTVHANCCRTIAAKMADLTQVVQDFQRYNRLLPGGQERSSFKWTNHTWCSNSWLK